MANTNDMVRGKEGRSVIVEMLEGRPVRIWGSVERRVSHRTGEYQNFSEEGDVVSFGLSVPYDGPTDHESLKRKGEELMAVIDAVLRSREHRS